MPSLGLRKPIVTDNFNMCVSNGHCPLENAVKINEKKRQKKLTGLKLTFNECPFLASHILYLNPAVKHGL